MNSRLYKLNSRIESGVDAPSKRLLTQLKIRNNTARIVEMYQSGLSAGKINKATGIDRCAIYRLLRKLGIERRAARRPKQPLCHCGKPSKRPGALCALHRRLSLASAARNYYRRKHQLPPKKWRAAY